MKHVKWLIISILLLAALIRLPQFGSIPVGLNRDEAALGYNAFSILHSGKDEYGRFLPVSITSFGDQKLPGYVYTLIPFIAALGTSATVIKLPSFLAGLAVIVLVGRITWHLQKGSRMPGAAIAPWLAMLLVAISPWGNHFSRLAYEAHLAMAFYLFGITAWLEAEGGKLRQRCWLLLAAVGFAASLLTYHSYHILTPLTVLGIAFLRRSEVKKMDRVGIFGGFIVGVATLVLMWIGGVWSANQTKLAGISPFSAETIQQRYFIFRQAFPGDTPLEKILANRLTEPVSIFTAHLVESVSTDFLFTRTTDHHVHNQSGIGNLHLFLAPFIFLGLTELWNRRKEKTAQLLWLWLLAGLVAPALTISPQHTIRFSPVFPMLEMTAALGIGLIWSLLKRRSRTMFAIGLGFVLLFSVLRYQLLYLVVAPQRDRQYAHEKWHILADALKRYRTTADQLITQSPASSPYIWYALETPLAPTDFQEGVERYPADKEGFQHVRRLGNVFFETIDWDDIAERVQTQSILLFLQPDEISSEQLLSGNFTLRETLTDRFGEPVFFVVEAHAQ